MSHLSEMDDPFLAFSASTNTLEKETLKMRKQILRSDRGASTLASIMEIGQKDGQLLAFLDDNDTLKWDVALPDRETIRRSDARWVLDQFSSYMKDLLKWHGKVIPFIELRIESCDAGTIFFSLRKDPSQPSPTRTCLAADYGLVVQIVLLILTAGVVYLFFPYSLLVYLPVYVLP